MCWIVSNYAVQLQLWGLNSLTWQGCFGIHNINYNKLLLPDKLNHQKLYILNKYTYMHRLRTLLMTSSAPLTGAIGSGTDNLYLGFVNKKIFTVSESAWQSRLHCSHCRRGAVPGSTSSTE